LNEVLKAGSRKRKRLIFHRLRKTSDGVMWRTPSLAKWKIDCRELTCWHHRSTCHFSKVLSPKTGIVPVCLQATANMWTYVTRLLHPTTATRVLAKVRPCGFFGGHRLWVRFP
jgi:hypothetical protein